MLSRSSNELWSPPRPFDESYEVHDQPTITSPSTRQRQQLRPAQINPHHSELPSRSPSRSASSTSSGRIRLLRRSSGLENIRTTSPALGLSRSSIARFATQLATVEPDLAIDGASALQNPPLAAQPGGNHITYQSSLQQSSESFWPRRTNRISSRTASAILWVLEEAIRQPFIFTPDLSELNASMSELVGGTMPSGSTGNGRPQNGTSRPAPGPIAGQSNPPSGFRTPTDIMRQRRDREARKKAEQEARERDKQETEWRLQQEQELQQQQIQQFPQPGRHLPAAGAASEPLGQRRQGGGVAPQDQGSMRDRASGGGTSRIPTGAAPASTTSGLQPVVPSSSTRQQAVPPESRITGDGAQQPQTSRQRGASIPQHHQRPAPASSQPSVRTTGAFAQRVTSSSQARPQTMPAQAAPPREEPRTSQTQQTEPPYQTSQQTQSQTQQQQSRPRAAFPHAFERWETLSSHWEGLTGYWIRRLEQNNEELSRDPLSQQMSRQITDLSAAGANLFHAVVELQRLRASSERKFQRWFFDTRAEQERAQEVQAELEGLLRTERQARAEAANSIAKAESDKLKAGELVREMRRELQISKDEARRAWEELGRREQEERDRTVSLRNGEPTIVGGVQVVPMMQSALSRQTSTNRPPTREGPYPGGPGPTTMGGQTRQDVPESTEQYTYDSQVSSPTATDPFVETTREPGRPSHNDIGSSSPSRQPPTSAAAMSAVRTAAAQTQAAAASSPYSQSHHAEDSHGRFYQHEPSALHSSERKVTGADERAYAPSSEPGGSDVGSEEYDHAEAAYRRNTQDRDRRIVYPRTISDDSDDYENMEHMPEGEFSQRYEGMPGIEYGDGTPGSSPEDIQGTGYGSNVDYSGSGWGGAPTWDSVTPRHRHPTRLSDVLEEDERSRTSPSRASQTSRGMH
ncbi:hypothetical protein ACJ73_06685 [Blastomyces percursus]|uniref:Uncharacterized protein n=1 Tax=Blastomyces percursus TaxID=1658174 RepID=A0A1J9QP45_9EURO|nr:hypothetical protein ACJ73_06685 [Blastomyces percursus]